ncbi:heat-inducible transcription repressor HrcA [bacterium]|nr:MAG: heat-inducible transcription repressor HrcA [bacterium]
MYKGKMGELKPRQKAILAAVIERYVRTAEPVGSAAVANDPLLGAHFGALSGATVRNELAELEALGFLAQPHTSAGRIPTDIGYRFYVREMLQPREVSAQEYTQLERVAPPAASVEDALREAVSVLTKLTGYPAVASLPNARGDQVQWLQLNPVALRRLVLVLVTAQGRIEHRLFDVGDEVPVTRLETVVRFLNETLGGQPLSKARSLDFALVAAGLHDEATLKLARRAWEMVCDSVSDIVDEKIVVQGLITLLDEPEFAHIGQARAAMRLLEDEAALADLIKNSSLNNQHLARARSVSIGADLVVPDHPAAKGFSFVGVSYGAGDEIFGALGVLGPARMRYADALALVPALAARLQLTLESF